MSDESRFVDYSKLFPDDLDEHTKTLLKLAKVYVTAKKILAPSIEDVDRRAKEKRISFAKARQELINEVKHRNKKMMDEALKQIAPSLSEKERERLGIKRHGRPKGAKNTNVRISKAELYQRLGTLVNSMNQMGEELRQEEAAKLLGVGGTRQIRRLLRDYGDERKWKEIVSSLLVK